MSNNLHHVVAGLCVVVALLVGYFIRDAQGSRYVFSEKRSPYVSGQLTNPLLECSEGAEELSIGARASIEREVTAYVDRSVHEGLITDVAIYFRDLQNGPWFGINERELYTPGSLLKVPLAMSYYQLDQRDHHALDQQVDFLGSERRTAVEDNYDSDTPLPTGVYSLRDLIDIMLKDSSNDAAEVLAEYAGKEQLQSVYNQLGIQEPELGKDYAIDVKTFGAFFRVLYNASYLGQPGSEDLLATLSQSTFRDGLVAGVPENIKVAHKFGTRVAEGVSGGRQLHDCGIVYAPKTPYILCVMTRGNSSKSLSYFIANVSEIVYKGVNE